MRSPNERGMCRYISPVDCTDTWKDECVILFCLRYKTGAWTIIFQNTKQKNYQVSNVLPFSYLFFSIKKIQLGTWLSKISYRYRYVSFRLNFNKITRYFHVHRNVKKKILFCVIILNLMFFKMILLKGLCSIKLLYCTICLLPYCFWSSSSFMLRYFNKSLKGYFIT